jgi:hypothetical protein
LADAQDDKKKTDGQFFTADDKNKSVTGHFDEFGLVDLIAAEACSGSSVLVTDSPSCASDFYSLNA